MVAESGSSKISSDHQTDDSDVRLMLPASVTEFAKKTGSGDAAQSRSALSPLSCLRLPTNATPEPEVSLMQTQSKAPSVSVMESPLHELTVVSLTFRLRPEAKQGGVPELQASLKAQALPSDLVNENQEDCPATSGSTEIEVGSELEAEVVGMLPRSSRLNRQEEVVAIISASTHVRARKPLVMR